MDAKGAYVHVGGREPKPGERFHSEVRRQGYAHKFEASFNFKASGPLLIQIRSLYEVNKAFKSFINIQIRSLYES